MYSKKYCNLEENMKIRNKLLNLGIGYTTIGPRGPKGDKGDNGDQMPSANEGLVFLSYNAQNNTGPLEIDNTWIIPNDSSYFEISNNQIKLQPGIYEITFVGLIKQVDNTHGGELYLENEDGAIKDLHYILEAGSLSQMHFSQNILFRFERETTLKTQINIIGDEASSNITIENVTLTIKKIHE